MPLLGEDVRTLTRVPLSSLPAAEHFMGMSAIHRPWTGKEVRALIAESPLATPRYELVDGELLVTPSPSRWHQSAVAELLVALHKFLAEYPIGRALPSPSDVELEPDFISQPDVFVVPIDEWRQPRYDTVISALMLAIEVVSPGSGRYDRVHKRRLYQRHVPEYWIVDLDARLIERWCPDDERPQIITGTVDWQPAGAGTSLRLELPAFFSRVLDS